MTSYEVCSLCISVAAFGAALVANVRSWKAVKAAEAANRIARAQNDEVKAVNCPQLVFTCDTENPDFNFFIIRVKVSNSGNHVTEIVKGQIALHSDKYLEAEKPYE